MEPFRAIDVLDARKSPGLSAPVRTLVAMARAGVPVPEGVVLSRGHVDALLGEARVPSLGRMLLSEAPEPTPEQVHDAWENFRKRPLPDDIVAALGKVASWLEGLGAKSFTVSAALVCERAELESVLGGVRLAVTGHDALVQAVRDALVALYDLERIRHLREHHVLDAGVCITVQRMVEGTVSGVVYTRHPLMRDDREWLVRAGFGLTSAVRRGIVPSDVWRVTRAGLVRDVVIQDKHTRCFASPDGTRAFSEVPEAARLRPGLSEPLLLEVLKMASRVERQLGTAMVADWAIADGRVYVVRAESDVDLRKPRKVRENGARSERDLWSNREIGEAVPDALTPLTWSLLRRFTRLGLSRTLSAVGATVSEEALVTEVRGHAYLNIGALTYALCRLPFVSPSVLANVGLEPAFDIASARASSLALARAALSFYDAQVRFRGRLPFVAEAVSRERSHFAGIDPRLLSLDALERELCDVELWLRESGEALMRCYGLWLTALVAMRAIFKEHIGEDALRVERDLLWGVAEIEPVSSARDMLEIACKLADDKSAMSWADHAGEAPRVVSLALEEMAQRCRHQGLVLMDPASPRWHERLSRLGGALRVLLQDPMARALAIDRAEVARGRRERAEREWRRRVPLALRPLTALLIRRVRELTKTREQLLLDAAKAITVVRDITLDASRRLQHREPDLPADSAYYLELSELHELLSHRTGSYGERIRQRHLELEIAKGLPPAASRFALRAREAGEPQVLSGRSGSLGAAEGKVVRLRTGDELDALPRSAVLVVRACDVGLAPILPAVRAVVSETGGLLSHGAMVGSALGVPVVVGVEGALTRLRDGQRVRVDADRCEVTVLDGV